MAIKISYVVLFKKNFWRHHTVTTNSGKSFTLHLPSFICPSKFIYSLDESKASKAEKRRGATIKIAVI